MAKSAAFGVMHLGIAFSVSYALTGSYTIAGLITVVEPLVNTVAHYFFDRGWQRHRVDEWVQRQMKALQRRWAPRPGVPARPIRVGRMA